LYGNLVTALILTQIFLREGALNLGGNFGGEMPA
jgi:hypothetical protein